MLTTIEKKRNLIDVREDTLRTLSVKAAMEGTSLKKLIEEMAINPHKYTCRYILND